MTEGAVVGAVAEVVGIVTAEEMIIVSVAEISFHGGQGIFARDDEAREGKMPFELVQFGAEGIGEDEVIVNELTIGATGAIRDAPAQGG